MIDDVVSFSFDEDEDSGSIGDLIDLIKSRYAEEDEKREKERASNAKTNSSDESSNYESNIAAIAKAVKESNERQKVDSAKHDNDRVKRQQNEEKKAAASRTSNASDDRKIAQFSKVNADEIRKVFATLNMQQVVKNLDMYTSSINKYIDGMHTVMSMGTSFYDSLHSRLATKAASESIDQTAMRAKASEISSDMKTVIDSKQALGENAISSIPQTGSSAGASSDEAMKSVSTAISKALQAGKSVTKTPGIVSEATDTIAKPASEALDSAVTSKLGTAASGALADGAETAATGAIGSGIAGAAGDAAGTTTAAGAAGGGLMSLAGNLLTKVNPVLAGVTAVGALAKAGMEGYRDAERQGNVYGLGADEGAKMMASGGWQDAQKFLGLTEVSGKDLANFRASASDTGLSYGSEAFNASIELKKSIKDSGLPDSMMSMADQMLKTGASTDAVKSSMDALKDTAKTTGQSLDDITKSAAGIGNKINQGTGGSDGEEMAADVQANLEKTVKDTTGATIGVKDAQALVSNKAFLQGLGSLGGDALAASQSSVTATRYLNDHPEDASRAMRNMLRFNTLPGTSTSEQYMNENNLDRAGLGAVIGSVDRARKVAVGESDYGGSKSTSRKSRSNSDTKSSSDINIKISADDGLYAKMAKKDETLQRIYSGSDSMRIGK
jgi:hypothetical protein